MSAKINNSYGQGYRIAHDADMRAFEEKAKREERQSGRGKRGRDANAPGEVKKQTWMLPFTFICGHCGRRCSQGTKIYARIRVLGKDQWKLGGRIKVEEIRIRCIFCPGKIVLHTDHINGDYVIVEGGERIKGDWKEQQDAEKEKEAAAAQLLSNDQARHQDMLLRAQKVAEDNERLQKFIAGRKPGDLQKKADKLLNAMKTAGSTTSNTTSAPAGGDQSLSMFDPLELLGQETVGDDGDSVGGLDDDEEDDVADLGVVDSQDDDDDDVYKFDWELSKENTVAATGVVGGESLDGNQHQQQSILQAELTTTTHSSAGNAQEKTPAAAGAGAGAETEKDRSDGQFDESDPFADSDDDEGEKKDSSSTGKVKLQQKNAPPPQKTVRSGGALSRLMSS